MCNLQYPHSVPLRSYNAVLTISSLEMMVSMRIIIYNKRINCISYKIQDVSNYFST